MLTKTNYILFRECAKNTWIKVHKPDIYYAHELSEFEKQIIETGNEVELVARELWPTGVLVEEKNEAAVSRTQELLDSGAETIFQAAFEKDHYFAAVDVLKRNANDTFSIYEIKATNSIDKKTHYHDLAFQVNLLRRCGLEIESAHLLHLNPEYVRQGELDLTQLFVIEDVTEKITEMQEEVTAEMKLALDYVSQVKEPVGPCDCIYKGRSSHCTTFCYSNPSVPKYGVHDLSRIGASKAKLTELIDSNIFELSEVPQDLKLSDIQKNQLWTHLTDQTIISRESIAEELDSLAFPLYFLDYETFPSALPRFDNFSPYNQIPFQYSLHILHKPDDEPEHMEFLFTDSHDPSHDFVASLQKHIGPIGSVIVWHKDFECGRNKELGIRIPESADFLAQLESRIYDLETIFKRQLHVHKNYKGSSSIKKVLPVLVPTLSYKDLPIREGGSAADAWNKVASGTMSDSEKAETIKNLLAYCKLDTFAMYAIWRELYKLVN